jgi:hypothetical protein
MLKRTVLILTAAATIAIAAPLTTLAQEATMPELPTPTESGHAEVNGVKIWYQTYGEGDPLDHAGWQCHHLLRRVPRDR